MKKLVYGLLMFCLVGCSTVITGAKQKVFFDSDPQGALVKMNGVELGETPFEATVQRMNAPVLTFSKEGYQLATRDMTTEVDPWFWGNIIIGGEIGSTTDLAAGSVRKYDDRYFAKLIPEDKKDAVGSLESAEGGNIRLFLIARYSELHEELILGDGENLRALSRLMKGDEIIDEEFKASVKGNLNSIRIWYIHYICTVRSLTQTIARFLMKSTGFTLLAILSFVLAGCGGGGSGDESSGSSSSVFSGSAESIAISDFYVTSTLKLAESQVRSIINSRSIFYNNMPTSGGSSTESQCIDNLEDAYGVISKSGDSYQFKFKHDIKNCRSNSTTIKSENKDRLLTHWTRVINGESIDLTQYKRNQLPNASSGTYIYKSYTEKIWNNDNKFERLYFTSSHSNSTQPCEWTNSYINNCEVRDKYIFYYNNDMGETISDVELEKYRWVNVSNSGGTYYASGSIQFTIENWSGTMTFLGSNTPSTYTAYNGSQTITGTLDPTSTAFADDEIGGLKY